MARQQIVTAQGDVDNQPPVMYRGRLEEIPGCLRLVEANFIELYGTGTPSVGPQGPPGAAGPAGPAGAQGPSGTSAGPGVLVANTPGSGSIAGFSPSGFSSTTDRLDITTSGSDLTIGALPVGTDSQRVRIRNVGNANLILTSEDTGETAATRFLGAGTVTVPAGDNVDIVYYAGSVNRWTM